MERWSENGKAREKEEAPGWVMGCAFPVNTKYTWLQLMNSADEDQWCAAIIYNWQLILEGSWESLGWENVCRPHLEPDTMVWGFFLYSKGVCCMKAVLGSSE